MHYFKRITLASLVVSSLVPSAIIADNKERLLKRLEEEKKVEKSKANFLAGAAVLILGTTVAYNLNNNINFLQDTGLGVGLCFSSIFYAASYMFPENAKGLRQIAYVSPALAMLGTAVQSDAISAKDGIAERWFGRLAVDRFGRKVPAFTALSIIAAYKAADPLLNKLRALAKSTKSDENQ